jgi:dTDP-4-amino-4,6-dideoxygalactose transaminase
MSSEVMDKLAVDGGTPVIRRALNRYRGATAIGDEEKRAVMEVLDSRSLFRYYGPNFLSKVATFEQEFARLVLFYLPSAEKADEVVRALRGEGVPAGKVYGGQPVYAAAQILNQWTITDGCPFNCPSYFPEPIRYEMGMCPRSEALLARGVSVGLGPFFEEEDLDDVITGVRKVAHHLLQGSYR